MAAKRKNTDGYDEPNPELGSAREAAEAAAAPPPSASTPPTDAPDNNTKDGE